MKVRGKRRPTEICARRAVLVLVAAALSFTAPALAQSPAMSEDGLWVSREPGRRELLRGEGLREPDAMPPSKHEPREPRAFRVYELAMTKLERALDSAPMEFVPRRAEDELILSLPMPDGSFARVRVERSPILSPELQRKRPEIQTYRFQGVDRPEMRGRLGLTSLGFHAWVLDPEGTTVIEPHQSGRDDYQVYRLQDLPSEPFECQTEDGAADAVHALRAGSGVKAMVSPTNPSGDTLRTYSLAINATGEFTQTQADVAAAENRIAAIVNNVATIYESEVAISFVLVRNNAYPDPEADPFSEVNCDDGLGPVLGENQTLLDDELGSGGYDIGHVIVTSNCGLASVGVTCKNDSKGRGATGGEGGRFTFVLAHEIGHQFNARHSWNGNCLADGSQYHGPSAYEPGSGSTIMSYAGVCQSGNIQNSGDGYFHTWSFDVITGYRDGDGACGSTLATGNTIPIVDAGPDYTIPQSTPFTLTAAHSDPDVGPVLIAWEQFDLGDQEDAPLETFTSGPMFRSRPATADPSRTFPPFSSLLAGDATPWEVLPAVDRNLTFRAIARDNRAAGGGVDYDTMTVQVAGDPFTILSPIAGDTLECAMNETISWQVGGGSVAPNVRVKSSFGAASPFNVHIASTPNDGSADVAIPAGIVTNSFGTPSRFLIEAIDNIFFTLSDEFRVVDTIDPTVTAPPAIVEECTGQSGTPVNLGTATATDVCDASVVATSNAPALFPLGQTLVTWSSTDDAANTGSDTQLVTIVDTTPAAIELSVTPTVLWPANHKMLTVQAHIEVLDVCDPNPQVRLVSIVSNEPDNDLGDGNTEPDIQEADLGTDDREFLLRAERSGKGSGRTYTINYEVEDSSGNVAMAEAVVTVPRNQ